MTRSHVLITSADPDCWPPDSSYAHVGRHRQGKQNNMNVIAGILIGWFNDIWLARLLVPFGWGVVWCTYKFIMAAHVSYGEEMKNKDLLHGTSYQVA